MACEAFLACKIVDPLINLLQSIPGIINKRGFFNKIIYGKRAGKPGRSAGRQRMIGACKIVAQRLGAIFPQKDGAGISDLREVIQGIIHTNFDMLRGNFIGRLNGLFQTAG